MAETLLVGLTGMSGSGKTTVCDYFRAKDIDIIDCDKVARFVVQKDFPCLDEIRESFGNEVILKSGELNRKKLGEIIFKNDDKKQMLEKIIFPYIVYQVFSKITDLKNKNRKIIILDAPTLFESGMDKICDVIISIVSDLDICAERISKRDNISLESARQRLIKQHGKEFFIKNSTYYINNVHSVNELNSSTENILDELIRRLDG
ncbi:MAG: dephospho-CoA kinase [Clostridiales bacterium]|nr:dephospho-CoA kinase [Clostridiales bacterium]